MAHKIEDAQERHLDRLEELEKACFSMPMTRTQLENQLPDSRHVFLVAEDTENVVQGYVGMLYVLDEGYISNVAVAPEQRRKGIAGSLLEELMRRAQALSLAFVSLEVRAGNAPAIALYEKHGFRPAGVRKNYYSMPREDAIIMTKFMK